MTGPCPSVVDQQQVDSDRYTRFIRGHLAWVMRRHLRRMKALARRMKVLGIVTD